MPIYQPLKIGNMDHTLILNLIHKVIIGHMDHNLKRSMIYDLEEFGVIHWINQF
jgi:hypothetical protein